MNKVHLLVADSHDSFVYNLVEILRKCPNCTFDVVATEHCSSLTLENYQGILLSPGPGHPEEVKGLMPLIARTVHTHSLLGVCLGHQALALHFGGQLLQMPHPLHGHAERLSIKEIEGRTLLEQLPSDSSLSLVVRGRRAFPQRIRDYGNGTKRRGYHGIPSQNTPPIWGTIPPRELPIAPRCKYRTKLASRSLE